MEGRGEVRARFETFCKAEPVKKLMTVKEFLDFINNHQRDPREEMMGLASFRIRRIRIISLDPDPYQKLLWIRIQQKP